MSFSLAVAFCRAIHGVNAPLVSIETHLGNGLPAFLMVGLAEKALKESKERVRSALSNSYFEFPAARITVNMAPADLPKDGGRFDLAIAVGILAASGQMPLDQLDQYEFIGELGLSGDLRGVSGVLPAAAACKKAGKTLVVSKGNAEEAALVSGLTILPVAHLCEVVSHFNQYTPITPFKQTAEIQTIETASDMRDIIGQAQARRALEIAAAGLHSLLMTGPPGTGKTLLASRLPSILPSMSENDALEAASLASVSIHGFNAKRWKQRPFRSPHHSASSVALVGGGNPPRPGEISLAHHGVLFLDELPEFGRPVLEALREPLESHMVTISRAARQADFPANFQLVAAMNPCPCGYYGDKEIACRCTPDQIQRYRSKISGPLLDRIDMHIEVTRLPTQLLTRAQADGESSQNIRERTEKSAAIQHARQQSANSRLKQKQLKRFCVLNPAAENLLETAIDKFNLSVRAYHRILKVARTIADLADSDHIQETHIAEALSFRLF
jgi:magnesium chelatase family protein